MKGRVLIVAGSDSGGGAGIQADIKTVTALGGFAMTAITALTAQNTLEVRDVLPVPPEFVRKQIDVVLDDIGVDAVKIGMLHDAEVIQAVASLLRVRCAATPLVVDPVMVAESGARLLAEDAIDALKERLIPQATVITPNLPEAEALLGRPIPDIAAARAAAAELRERFGVAVLLKGGHLQTRNVTDILATADGRELLYSGTRLETNSSHGTGCTLASAIATRLAQGLPLEDAVEHGREYLREAIRTAVPLGKGSGPVNHGHCCGPFELKR
ncbi:MAG: bifunctional hydroxymethylpyrimidine kinase/phosphomethylpyrimidine kinase [Xanthomonadaceae bacterium]|nr:bifunctional hydroxymethylpyrimidine kinase/phosphomethylpyrimidine kinase [Xanthomonadaceae bacterium]